ncbi:LAMI_0G12530g1_1 [Lachancea mirantina]|uniref:LAMI_0G12530g1_1 n=1 Tax=Lachancea mirantina TaxID=1230905 RepID=A0A1G4KBE0_9SACH|nr:LAMI_0G12530g1_1 [Lachancea mirantina]
MTLSSIVFAILQTFFYYFAYILKCAVPLCARTAREHPVATNIFGYVVATYILWKVFCHLLATLRKLIYVAVAVLAVLAWIRGPHRVLFQDIPTIVHIFRTDADIQQMWRDVQKYMHTSHLQRLVSATAISTLEEMRLQFLRVFSTL